ncbi:MAG: ABC transporter ATP-binding protein, partial [Clostridia bacterium]|nr:ABC transporter ATP-binding protein [Clostridia bacterium]
YAGRIVEKGTVQEIFGSPAHPYTIGLMMSKPIVGRKIERLYNIPGSVPNPINMPNYCYFKDRCEKSIPACYGVYPPMIKLSETHYVACYLFEETKKEVAQ